jgi:outer membrane protein assembly factor BamD (BamD/ComL family)
VAAVSGCSSTGGFLTAWRTARDSSLSRGPTEKELGDDRGLMSRWLTPKSAPNADPNAAAPSPLVLGSDGWKPMKPVPNPEAEAEFQAAEKLYQQGKLVEAEKEFVKVAKNRKGTSWGEKAQFYLAESQFQRGKLVAANDSYELLFAHYPGTIYLEKLIAREYEIGQRWLAQADPKTPANQRLPWTSHFDGRQPLLDTSGYATKALEHVRQHDPTGPLADDAVLKIADYHMENADYEMAAIHYDQLITDHPKSPFLQKAQLAAIDARIKGYLGPEYDGAGLDQARELIKQTMVTFPDRPAGNEKLYHTLDLINDQEAERTYVVAAYYKKIGKVPSAEYYFGKIRQRWPKSVWAAKAKTDLATLAKMPRTKSLPSKIMSQPGSYDPFSNTAQGGAGPGGMMGMGPGGMGNQGMGMGMGGMGAPGGMM